MTREGTFTYIAAQKLVPSPENVREGLGDLQELASSVEEKGILQPLLVRDLQDKRNLFEIVAGHRRYAAGQMVGLASYPCVVRDLTDVEALEAMVIENTQRRTINPIEEAKALVKLVESGLKEIEVARRISRSPTHVHHRLQLLELPITVQKEVAAGERTATNALKRFARRKDYRQRIRVYYSVCTTCPYVQARNNSHLGPCPKCGGPMLHRTSGDDAGSLVREHADLEPRPLPHNWEHALDDLYKFCRKVRRPFVPARELAEQLVRGPDPKVAVQIVKRLIEGKPDSLEGA